MPKPIIRIGLGLAVLGTVFAWLWPSDLSAEFGEGTNIIAFLSALIVWIAAEFWVDERKPEAVEEEKIGQQSSLAQNDLRNARQLLTYHQFFFRDLLKHQDLGGYFDYSYLSELHAFNHANETKQFEFLEESLSSKWSGIAKLLLDFGRFMAQHTTPHLVAGREMVRLDNEGKPEKDSEAKTQPSDADKGNELASNVWSEFDQFVEDMKREYPHVLDQPVKPEMFYVHERDCESDPE